MNAKKIYKALLGLVILLYSCSENEEVVPDPTLDLAELATVSDQGMTVTLLGEKSLEVGFNALALTLEDENGDPVSGEVELLPLMDMTTMKHSCPVEFPKGKNLAGGILGFNVAFVMPSGDMGSWTLEVTTKGKKIVLPVEVTQPAQSRLVSFVGSPGDNETKYFVCLLDPEDPKVGQNDVHLAIFKKQSMMEWPAVDDVEIEMTPWMPSMDHGSPNNVNPVHDEDGHYRGKVNFTMTGSWEIDLKFTKGELLVGETHFEVSF